MNYVRLDGEHSHSNVVDVFVLLEGKHYDRDQDFSVLIHHSHKLSFRLLRQQDEGRRKEQAGRSVCQTCSDIEQLLVCCEACSHYTIPVGIFVYLRVTILIIHIFAPEKDRSSEIKNDTRKS
jgi:hypothetical protein